MKILIVGLGSMGKRRIRNLKHLGVSDIAAYDPRQDRRSEAHAAYGIDAISDWGAAEALAADAWIISTPPDTHMDYALKAVDKGVHFFTEANVTDTRARELIERLNGSGLVGAPSCTMRYYAGPATIKRLVKEGSVGRPLVFTYQAGQYLPDWHPWENYKDFYVSKRETGACREIVPFELGWLTDIFGPVASLTCLKDKVSDLDADIDDIYHLLLRHESHMVGHLMVDVVARPAVRLFRLNGSEGTIEWDHGANQIRLWQANAGSWQTLRLEKGTVEEGYLHAEEPYIREMEDFLAAVGGERPWPYSFDDDEKVLDLLVRAERSAAEGVHC